MHVAIATSGDVNDDGMTDMLSQTAGICRRDRRGDQQVLDEDGVGRPQPMRE